MTLTSYLLSERVPTSSVGLLCPLIITFFSEKNVYYRTFLELENLTVLCLLLFVGDLKEVTSYIKKNMMRLVLFTI